MIFLTLIPQVGQAKDEALTNLLIDYLMGESDGMPKVHSAPHRPFGLTKAEIPGPGLGAPVGLLGFLIPHQMS